MVRVKDSRITVTRDTWARDTARYAVLRALPGARVIVSDMGITEAISYPATPEVAAQLACVVQSDNRDFIRLVEQAAATAAAVHVLAHERGAGDEPLSMPPLLRTTPWSWQLRAYHCAMACSELGLAYGMGSGKSKVAIDVFQNLVGRDDTGLVLCPNSVVNVWPTQVYRHGAIDIGVCALGGKFSGVKDKAKHLKSFLENRASDKRLVVVNYESAWRPPLKELLLSRRWPIVILDESHRIKSPGGAASRFCALLRDRADRRLCLTGTPMPHSRLDVFAQMRFLDPGIFGSSFTAFRARYAVMGGYGQHQVVGWQNLEEFGAKFWSRWLRVTLRDVMELPPETHVELECELSGDEKRVYQQLDSQFTAEVKDGTVTASNALVKLLRLAQAANGFVTSDDGSLVNTGGSKRALLKDSIEDIEPSEPVVVFCRFHHDLDVAKEVAKELGRSAYELSGRRNELELWQGEPIQERGSVLVAQLQTGKEGIDLTRASYCIYYSLGFSLGDYEQSLARCMRPGQTRHVTYIHLTATRTVDQKIRWALQHKKDLVQAVYDIYRTGLYEGGEDEQIGS